MAAADDLATADPIKAVVEVVARALVDHPDAVRVTENERRGMTVLLVDDGAGRHGQDHRTAGTHGRRAADAGRADRREARQASAAGYSGLMTGTRDSGFGIRSGEANAASPGSRIPDPGTIGTRWCSSVASRGRTVCEGQVVVNPETDFVEERFAAGATVWTRSAAGDEQLTVASMRVQNGRPIVGFEGFERIEDVERLAGLELRVPEEALQPLQPGNVLRASARRMRGRDGRAVTSIGEVAKVEGGAGASAAGDRRAAGRDADSAGRRHLRGDRRREQDEFGLVAPDGLLDLNETRA